MQARITRTEEVGLLFSYECCAVSLYGKSFDSLRRRLSTLRVAERSLALMGLPEEGIFSKSPMLIADLMAEFWAV